MELVSAFISLAVVSVVLVIVYAHMQNKIRSLESRNRYLDFQKNLYSDIIRESNEKGVPPEELGVLNKEQKED